MMQLGPQQRTAPPCSSRHWLQPDSAQKFSSGRAAPAGRRPVPAQHRAEQLGRTRSGAEASASYGPAPPPPKKKWNGVVPEWVRDLEADAPYDEDVARLLEGCGGNPELIRERMRESMSSKRDEIVSERFGEQAPMTVKFREVDPFNLWVWFELYKVPSGTEREMLEAVLSSWFMVGRLGGFNAMNMQVFNNSADDHSYLNYDAEECESSLDAFFHDMSPLEANGTWMRLWVNLGTSDELALDILINALSSFSKESVGIKQLVFGGENKDWKVPEREIPRTSIDPMQGPINMRDMDEIDMEDY